MSDDWTEAQKNARQRIFDAVQSSARSDENIEEAVLIGYVLVAEWSDPEGGRWISTIAGSDGGEDSPSRWTVDGYLHYGLYKFDKHED